MLTTLMILSPDQGKDIAPTGIDAADLEHARKRMAEGEPMSAPQELRYPASRWHARLLSRLFGLAKRVVPVASQQSFPVMRKETPRN